MCLWGYGVGRLDSVAWGGISRIEPTHTLPLYIPTSKPQGIEQELERRAREQAGKKGAKEPFLAIYRTMSENLLHRLRYDRSESVPQVCFYVWK